MSNARGRSLPELLVVDVSVVCARHEEGVLEVDLAVALAHVAHEVVVAAHHELADLDVVLLHGDLRLDEGVRVVDDGQEHVLWEQNGKISLLLVATKSLKIFP